MSCLGLLSEEGPLLQNGSSVWFSTDGESRFKTKLYQSANVCSVFVNADHDRSYVDSSASHSTKDIGAFLVFNANGLAPAVDAEMEFIRGRGNTTWAESDKKPYQVKLKKKANALGNEEKSVSYRLDASGRLLS